MKMNYSITKYKMAKKRYINTKFWSDSYIRKLDNTTKQLYLYLLTNEHTNIAGIYEIAEDIISFESGLSQNMVSKGMDTLSKDGKIFYKKDWLVLVNFMKHQNTKSPKVKLGVQNEFKLIPEWLSDTVSIDYTYLTIYLNLNSDSNLDLNLDSNSDSPEESSDELYEKTFNFFWEMYPNKKSKVVAKKLWNKLKMTEELYRKIIYSLQEQMNSKQWTKKDGEFIPHPSTWLNQERWNDEEVTPPKDLELENFFNSMK